MPFVTELWLLGTVSFATTLTSSYLNTGLESLLLNIFGVGGSTWVIAIYHAFFTIGGISAPLLVQVFKSSDPLKVSFLSRQYFSSRISRSASPAPIISPATKKTTLRALNSITVRKTWNHLFSTFYEVDADIIPPYIIVGAIVAASGIFTCVYAVWKLVEKLTTAKHDEVCFAI